MRVATRGKAGAWLHPLVADPLQRSNVLWGLASNLFATAGLVIVTGPVFQQYLINVGLDEEQIGIHGFAVGVAGAGALFLLSGLADRVRRRVRAVVICGLVAILLPVMLCVLSLVGSSTLSPSAILVVLVVLAVLLALPGSFGTFEISPPEVVDAFNGARFILLAIGGGTATYLVGLLLKSFDLLPIFMGGAALTFVNGVWYWYGFRRRRPD